MTRVYVTDLDGTLLDADARLSPTTRAGLLRLLDADVHLTVATARSLVSMQEILRGIPLRLPVVEMCGAALSHLTSGERLEVADMPTEVVEDIVKLTSARGLPPFVSMHTDAGDRLYHERPNNDGMRWYVDERRVASDPRLREVTSVSRVRPGRVVCLTAIGREAEIRAAADVVASLHVGVAVETYANSYSPGWWWASILSGRARKGPATRRLLTHAGLEGAEIVAFGDTRADLSLFQDADHAIAPSCAAEEIRAAADEVIGCHESSSVVRWLLADAGLEPEA